MIAEDIPPLIEQIAPYEKNHNACIVLIPVDPKIRKVELNIWKQYLMGEIRILGKRLANKHMKRNSFRKQGKTKRAETIWEHIKDIEADLKEQKNLFNQITQDRKELVEKHNLFIRSKRRKLVK